MNAEEKVSRRVRSLLQFANLAEVSRRIDRPRTTVEFWKKNPASIKAVDLIRLEDLLRRGEQND